MKKFFTAFFGSMAAIWVSVGLFFIGGFMMFCLVLGAIGGENATEKKHSILYLDLNGTIADRYSPLTLDDLMIGRTEEAQSFEDIINALHYAATDKNIDGVYINCSGSGLGYALREELQQALADFKKNSKGKWIYAYADGYSQGDYYVVSGADKIFLNPVGAVDIRGIASQLPSFKGALDKLGIEMQIVKVGTFKSAVEPFILEHPSEASILQTKVFTDAIWDNITTEIAKNRGVNQSTVNMWADTIIACQPAEVLVDNKLVTELKYRREVEDILRKKTKRDDDQELLLVTPGDYMKNKDVPQLNEIMARLEDEGEHIAILYAVGDIVDDGKQGIVGNMMVPEILDLAEDDNVKGLVLRVNSGGGSAFASEQIWEALEQFKKSGKPFYVSMGDYAASGGYYISCGADKIYANANTLTGSIGIFGMIPCAKQLANEHLGINFTTVQTNTAGDMGSLFVPLTPAERNALQQHVENGYDLFTGRVAAGRDLPIDSVRAIAEGRVWDGRTALRIGLVDELGSLTTAVSDMAKKLKMKKVSYTAYPKVKLTPFEELLNSREGFDAAKTAAQTNAAQTGLTPAEAAEAQRFIRNLRNANRVQARMPYLVVK